MSKTTIKVAFVTGTLPMGGTTTFLCNICPELIGRNFDCRVYSGDDAHPMASDFELGNIPVSLQSSALIFEDRLLNILNQLSIFDPDVVVCSFGTFSFELLRYLPNTIYKIGMVQSDDIGVYKALGRYRNFLDAVGGVSAAIFRKINEADDFKHIAKHNLAYGVQMPLTPPLREFTECPIRVIYFGRLCDEQKRVQLFPDILQALYGSKIPFHWTIAGDGPSANFLRETIKAIDIDQRVCFCGAVAYADVLPLLEKHDIFLLASDYEGLPLSLLEAMGCGVVPVVSDLESGMREVVDSSNGCLVPIWDTVEYANAIVHLHYNRSELAAKSKASRLRVTTEYSIQAMGDRWAEILRRKEQNSVWKKSSKILAPFMADKKIKYSFLGRILRRISKRFTSST